LGEIARPPGATKLAARTRLQPASRDPDVGLVELHDRVSLCEAAGRIGTVSQPPTHFLTAATWASRRARLEGTPTCPSSRHEPAIFSQAERKATSAIPTPSLYMTPDPGPPELSRSARTMTARQGRGPACCFAHLTEDSTEGRTIQRFPACKPIRPEH
jgi:hypothetical protein